MLASYLTDSQGSYSKLVRCRSYRNRDRTSNFMILGRSIFRSNRLDGNIIARDNMIPNI